MQKHRNIIIAILVLFTSIFGFSQETGKEKGLTITGITIKKGKSIESLEDAQKNEQVLDKVTKDLIKDQLITDNQNISYLLNNEKLVINGIEQASEIHLKYRERYLKDHKNWNICKNYKM